MLRNIHFSFFTLEKFTQDFLQRDGEENKLLFKQSDLKYNFESNTSKYTYQTYCVLLTWTGFKLLYSR